MLKAKKLYFDLIFKESSNYNKFALKNFKMQNLSITQNLNQKLSPQQIQFMKLLQVSSSNIEGIIKKELVAISLLPDKTISDIYMDISLHESVKNKYFLQFSDISLPKTTDVNHDFQNEDFSKINIGESIYVNNMMGAYK